MLTVRWGTCEFETALIILAPSLMMPRCSYSLPTMYPVVFCRNSSGTSVWLAELDELRGLVGLLAEQHAAVVGEHADGVAVDRRPARDEARPVQRLELVEARAVDDPGQHVAWVEGHAQVGRGDARAARRGRSTRLVGRHRRARPELVPS